MTPSLDRKPSYLWLMPTVVLMRRSYFALVRHSSAWMGPRHGKTNFSLDKDALLCSFLSHEGKHLVLLGISNKNNVMTLFRSSDSGPVMIHVSRSNPKPKLYCLADAGDVDTQRQQQRFSWNTTSSSRL